MKTYSVVNWEARYENNRTRDLKEMSWIPVPNTHDGDGYTTLVCRENGAALLGAWLAILQVASKCEPRGTLLRDTGKPHDAESIARMTRLPQEIIAQALDVCSSECNWLQINAPQEGAAIPQEGAAIPQASDYGREGKGRERNTLPTREEAIAGTMTAGIQPEFAGYVFDDWESRGGKDAAGNLVPWLRYVTKRWAREGPEWRLGTHGALKRKGNPAQTAPAASPCALKPRIL